MENEGTQLADLLDKVADSPLHAKPQQNPHKLDLHKAAKRIRWLELVVTGLSYDEKRKMGALARRVRELSKRIATKNSQIKYLNTAHRYEIKKLKDELVRVRRNAADISWEDKHKIIKQYLRGEISNYN